MGKKYYRDILNFQKNYKGWIKYNSKKVTKTGSANTCIFFCIFEKNYNDWIESFSKSKWTGLKDSVPPVVDRPHPLTTPLTVPPTSLGSKEASGRQIAFTLSSKTNGESNLRIARSVSNILWLSLYQDIRNYHIHINTVEPGDKELFGHPKIVPYSQMFLITNI